MKDLRKERQRILHMVAEGKISAQEAVQLLEALERQTSEASAARASKGKAPRWLRIYVRDEKDVINLKIPWRLVSWALRFSGIGLRFIPAKARDQMTEAGLDHEQFAATLRDLEETLRQVEAEETRGEDLIHIQSEDGEEVRIWVE